GSFSFGNGFQATVIKGNQLYAMAYFPQTAIDALHEAIDQDVHVAARVTLYDAATLISTAATPVQKAAALQSFIDLVDADRRNKTLTKAEADQLIALANVV